jgi:predicted enzyme related to lactoylglutathione lyase
MGIENALASVAVRDVTSAAAWYDKLLGWSGSRPMDEVAEWKFRGGGGLQVYAGPDRAGHCSCTLVVDGLEAVADRLKASGIDAGTITAGPRVKTAMLRDPDGNSIALAEALDPSLLH